MKNFFLILFLVVAFAGCNDQTDKENPISLTPLSEMNESSPLKDKVTRIKNYSILFGHHSVGSNIIEGLVTIARQTGEDYRIANIEEIDLIPDAHLVEFSPGKNREPISKIDHFVEQIARLPEGFSPDAAFLKFCYVDFTPDSDLKGIMAYYKEKIESLKTQFPDVFFFHCTVPLTTRPNNLKSNIKRLLGIQEWHDASNIARSRFNNLLRKTFPSDPIFDLALIESTRQDGTKAEFTLNNKSYALLALEFTDDGGHLNNLGRIVVAKELVDFLDNLPLLQSM